MMDPDVPKLQKLRKTLDDSVKAGVYKPEDALAFLQKTADALAKGKSPIGRSK